MSAPSPLNTYGVSVVAKHQKKNLSSHVAPIKDTPANADKSYDIALKEDFGAEAAGMPPIPRVRRNAYSYYKLEFLPSGYPGKHHNGKVIPHPIYGSYLINDYLIQYEQTNDPVYAKAASKIGYETLKLMKHNEKYDALCFYYYEKDALTYFNGDFISGLTQSRYLMPFLDLYHVSQDDIFRKGAEQILRSLKIPQSEGGVLIDTPHGIAVEEYPHEIPTFVLNGWTTIVLEILRYAKSVNNLEARAFAEENIRTIEKLLHKYEYVDLFSSRYQLSGFVYLKVVCNLPKNTSLTSFSTCVMGKWHTAKEGDTTRWGNYVLGRDIDGKGRFKNRQAVINAVFSQIDDAFKFELGLNCYKDCNIEIYVANGEYEPALSSMPSRRWILLDDIKLKAGHTSLEYEFNKDYIRLLGYPTNFAKKIGEYKYNVYHWLHINNFLNIQKYHNSRVFDHFLMRWTRFVNEWKQVPKYDDPEYSFENPSPPNESDSKNKLNRFKKDTYRFKPIKVLVNSKFSKLTKKGNVNYLPVKRKMKFATITDDSDSSYRYTCLYDEALDVGFYKVSIVIEKTRSDTEILLRAQSPASNGLSKFDVICDKSGCIVRQSPDIVNSQVTSQQDMQFTLEMVFEVKEPAVDDETHRFFLYPSAAQGGRLSNALNGSVGVGVVKIEKIEPVQE